MESEGGFTLIELLIVFGLLACLAAGGMPVSMSMYKTYIFQSEYINAIRLLEQARSLGHGVRFEEHKIIAFKGVYDPNSQSNLIFNQNVLTHSGNPEEVIFNTAPESVSERVLQLTDGIKIKHIFINAAGRIDFE